MCLHTHLSRPEAHDCMTTKGVYHFKAEKFKLKPDCCHPEIQGYIEANWNLPRSGYWFDYISSHRLSKQSRHPHTLGSVRRLKKPRIEQQRLQLQLELEMPSLEPEPEPVSNGIPTPHSTEILPKNTILIAGGGPVGLTLATVLAYYGVRSVVLERNETTTKWVIAQGWLCLDSINFRLNSDGPKWTSQMPVLWSFFEDWDLHKDCVIKVRKYFDNDLKQRYWPECFERCRPAFAVTCPDIYRTFERGTNHKMASFKCQRVPTANLYEKWWNNAIGALAAHFSGYFWEMAQENLWWESLDRFAVWLQSRRSRGVFLRCQTNRGGYQNRSETTDHNTLSYWMWWWIE